MDSPAALPRLVAHEAYPGHHTERCRKQVTQAGLPEYDLWLVNTPENLLAEGLADLGLVEAHHVATEAHHRLLHDVKGVDDVTVHVSPSSDGGEDHHAAIAHHRR